MNWKIENVVRSMNKAPVKDPRFDRSNCTVVKDGTALAIPCRIGYFTDADFAGIEDTETGRLLTGELRRVLGEKTGRKSDAYPAGTPITLATGLTLLFRLSYQQLGVDERTPAGTGRVSDAEFREMLAWCKKHVPADYAEAIGPFADDPIGNMDQIRRVVIRLYQESQDVAE